jgi:hypothetical protein
MRTNNVLFAILPILLLSFLTACDDNSNNGGGGNNGNNTPASGAWKVSQFFDKQDETNNYNGYTFEFGSTGSLIVANGSQNYNGTWSTGVDDSANKFVISFGSSVPSALSELEEDWRIIEMTDSLIHLEHTSGGNGDTDILKFTRL